MTSFRQFEANRRNALRGTGPKTEEGKRHSRLNAVRHGLTAETVVGNLEDAEDYKAFEAATIADYCAETAVARELVHRLASLLWRLRRATAIETELLRVHVQPRWQCRPDETTCRSISCRVQVTDTPTRSTVFEQINSDDQYARATRELNYSFMRLVEIDNGVFQRLNRYETALWRQAVQILFVLEPIKQRWSRTDRCE